VAQPTVHIETINHPGLDRLLAPEEVSYPQRYCWSTISWTEWDNLRLTKSIPDCPGRRIEQKGMDGLLLLVRPLTLSKARPAVGAEPPLHCCICYRHVCSVLVRLLAPG
jgi:hypothetical protein